MRRMLVVESVSACLRGDGHVAGNLAVEGYAMLTALLDDLSQVDGWQFTTILHNSGACVVPDNVVVLHATESDAMSQFERILAEVDAAWIVAPEIDGQLLELTQLAESAGCTLYSPDSSFVAVASDKTMTANRLQSQGIRMPIGERLDTIDTSQFLYPAVLKVNHGAGSLDMRRIEAESDLPPQSEWHRFRLEELLLGSPASVSFACGACGPVLIGTSNQNFEGLFAYTGGSVPLPPALAERATRLARLAMNAMPTTFGYVGVDLMLGDDASSDVVLEINPRLTTSYLGHRAARDENLAQFVIDVADGVDRITPKVAREVAFDCDGKISTR